jgi:hypothetical protein
MLIAVLEKNDKEGQDWWIRKKFLKI